MEVFENSFIESVVDYYYKTIDKSHPQGNMSAVAEQFSITRAKVNKLLITAEVIDSPLHQDIMKLKERGYENEDIALALGVSVTTVKINLPYEKAIYNKAEKSTGAGYVEKYRMREKVFLNNVVRKQTAFELLREANSKDTEYMEMRKLLLEKLNDSYFTDDPIHLQPVFSEDEINYFKIINDVMLLHIELEEDLTEVKDIAKIKYGKTISRDILVPASIPLHNLHYAINQAFGLTNSHPHSFKLNQEDMDWVTDGKVENWKKLIGLVFKNPLQDEDVDFWDDDYKRGSPKKWMRSKYTGPDYKKALKESYRYVREQVDDLKIKAQNFSELYKDLIFDPCTVNETIAVREILDLDNKTDYRSVQDYYDYLEECIEEAEQYPRISLKSQPEVYAFAKELIYEYDFGDGWTFTIEPKDDIEYLMKDGRLSPEEIREAIKNLCILTRPIVVAADGLPLVEDVGGVSGYKDFLKGINGLESEMYADKQESLEWAITQGWKDEIGNLKTIL